MSSDALFRGIVENANELITVFDTTGTIVFVNPFCRALLGYEPEALIGRGIIEFVHEEDQPRAAQTLQVVAVYGTIVGTTHFRLRAADGTYQTLEMSSGTIPGGDGIRLMTMSRPAGTRFALDSILRQLLENRSLDEVMTSVCELFAWHAIGTHVAVTWQDGDGTWRWLGTPGFPTALSGAPPAEGTPFAAALRSGEDQVQKRIDLLPSPLREEAQRAQRGGYWIAPVAGAPVPALVSLWTAGRQPPQFHAEGMQLARQLAQLILRWHHQHAQLDRAARFDELTGLANRPSFFAALAASAHGAVLYCDLDRFKPVNDQYGHAAGDEVLRQVANRLRAAVRGTDVVARIGGDEFAIICPSSTAADAAALANRLRAEVDQPITIGDIEVRVGISIGIAHTTDRLDAASVAAADRELMAAKASRQSGRRA